MSRRTLIPVLLTAALAVGCATAHAQDEPRPERDRHAEEVARENAEHRARLEEARAKIAVRRAELDRARARLDRESEELVVQRTRLQAHLEEIRTRLRDLEAEAAAARQDRGIGKDAPEMRELHRQMERLRADSKEAEDRLASGGVDLEPRYRELDQQEVELAQAAAKLGVPRAPGDAPPRRGRAGPPSDAPFAGPRGAAPDRERIARLERAVEELRHLMEIHGIAGDRRERAMAEMERRRDGERRGPPPGGVRERPEAPRPRAGRPDAPLPPADAAARAHAEELRRVVNELRTENADLRKELEHMRAEMARLREHAEELARERAEEEAGERR